MKFGIASNVTHAWFAWYPVRLFMTGEYVWLESVERTFRFNSWPRDPYYERRGINGRGES